MHRKTLNASWLQDEVKRRLQRLPEVVEDGVKIVVPRPQLQDPDRTGCNWTMRHFGNAAGFESSIAGMLAQVQAEYNLADEGEAHEEANPQRADPFGGTRAEAPANPFGDDKPAKAADPFGAFGAQGHSDAEGEKEETPRKRPANPFGD